MLIELQGTETRTNSRIVKTLRSSNTDIADRTVRAAEKQRGLYVAGLVAGTASTTTGYPLDVFRVRLLFHARKSNPFNGLAFAYIVSITKQGLVWPLQRQIHDSLDHNAKPGLYGMMLSGAVGNLLPNMIMNPANVVKVRLMESHVPHTVSSVVRSIYGEAGVRAFFAGMTATIARDGIWRAIYFPLFSSIRSHFPPGSHDRKKDIWFTMGSSAAAAGVSTLASSVFDGARLLQQKTHEHLSNSTCSASRSGSLWQNMRLAMMPTRANLFSTMMGVFRVTTTTVVGHIVFLKTLQYYQQTQALHH